VELREFCKRQGHELFGEYVDRESERKGHSERAEFARLLKDAERRCFDLVLFGALDRFSREGIERPSPTSSASTS
jgi:DNA invertase Pin-like site-specific DNA recombinase